MKGFFYCLSLYPDACYRFQVQGHADIPTNADEYLKFFTVLYQALVNLRSRFGSLSDSYRNDALMETEIREYLTRHLPNAMSEGRGDTVEFVKLWQQVSILPFF